MKLWSCHIFETKRLLKVQYNFFPTTCQNVRRNLLAQFHVHKIRKKKTKAFNKKDRYDLGGNSFAFAAAAMMKNFAQKDIWDFFMFTSRFLFRLYWWPFFQQNWVIVLIRQIFTFSGHLSLVSYRVNILTKVDRLRIHRSKLFEFLLNLCSGPNPTICRDTWSTLPKAFFCLRRIAAAAALVHFQAHGHDFTENG